MEWPELPQIEAFAAAALNVGMTFRMRARDTSEIAFTLNPVAARHLAACILSMGTQAGWLDASGHVTAPEMPPLDS